MPPVNFPVAVLLAVFTVIALRGLAPRQLPIWTVMLVAAAAVLASGDIAPLAALRAIDLDVMLFLFGVFVVGQALEESGYLYHLAYRVFRRARSADTLLLWLLFGAGLASAFLMNDTLAVIGTPLVLKLAHQHRMSPRMLLLGLAFAVTLGSVMSPIGNPQNLLIAVHGPIANPFVDFARYLALPTLINLFLAWALLRWFYRDGFHRQTLAHARVAVRDKRLARIARAALALLLGLAALKIALTLAGAPFELPLVAIALAAAAPILLFSPRRVEIVRRIDWHTLVFFAALFVLMAAVWGSGYFQAWMVHWDVDLRSTGLLFTVGVLVSQLVSNVPLVALLLPLLADSGAGAPQYLALAAGSTLAGNLFILGAASNVIIIQNAEKRGAHGLGFFEFARVGVPLTLVNGLVYWLFLAFL
jgi:Na+/H+ antiporter NhaD/arsenite permease-like protein